MKKLSSFVEKEVKRTLLFEEKTGGKIVRSFWKEDRFFVEKVNTDESIVTKEYEIKRFELGTEIRLVIVHIWMGKKG